MAEDGKRRQFFPDAFKLEAVAAVRGGRPVSQVAAELGLPDRLVRGWLRWAEGRGTTGTGTAAPPPPGKPAMPAPRVGPSPADQAAGLCHGKRAGAQRPLNSGRPHAAAAAARHCAVASPRSVRSVRREIRWRWTLKVL